MSEWTEDQDDESILSDLAVVTLGAEVTRMQRELDEAKIMLAELVRGIDEWNAAVETIIGAQPHRWVGLDHARAWLERNRKEKTR